MDHQAGKYHHSTTPWTISAGNGNICLQIWVDKPFQHEGQLLIMEWIIKQANIIT